VIAVSTNDAGRLGTAVIEPVRGFTTAALSDWAQRRLAPEAEVYSDGLAAFRSVIPLGHAHTVIDAGGGRAATQAPGARWANVVLGNVKRALDGTYHAFRFSKPAHWDSQLFQFGGRRMNIHIVATCYCHDRTRGRQNVNRFVGAHLLGFLISVERPAQQSIPNDQPGNAGKVWFFNDRSGWKRPDVGLPSPLLACPCVDALRVEFTVDLRNRS